VHDDRKDTVEYEQILTVQADGRKLWRVSLWVNGCQCVRAYGATIGIAMEAAEAAYRGSYLGAMGSPARVGRIG
jgi:hypothetical protein